MKKKVCEISPPKLSFDEFVFNLYYTIKSFSFSLEKSFQTKSLHQTGLREIRVRTYAVRLTCSSRAAQIAANFLFAVSPPEKHKAVLFIQIPMEDARESVAQISKLVRAARETTREVSRDREHAHGPRDAARDQAFEDHLRKKLEWQHFEVWLPPF